MIDFFIIMSILLVLSAAEEETTQSERNTTPVTFPIDEELVRTASIAVICGCIAVAILVSVCCFCSKCPLYNIFRRNLDAHDVAAFGAREEEPLTNGRVPLTAINGQSIRIKPVAEL